MLHKTAHAAPALSELTALVRTLAATSATGGAVSPSAVAGPLMGLNAPGFKSDAAAAAAVVAAFAGGAFVPSLAPLTK
jgi:hypothetical protein